MKTLLQRIKPSEIATQTVHWWDSFGRSETEVSAKLFVRACQRNGEWAASKEQLDKECSSGNYQFNGLDRQYIIKNGDKYVPTSEFVAIAFSKFPAKSKKDVIKKGSVCAK